MVMAGRLGNFRRNFRLLLRFRNLEKTHKMLLTKGSTSDRINNAGGTSMEVEKAKPDPLNLLVNTIVGKQRILASAMRRLSYFPEIL